MTAGAFQVFRRRHEVADASARRVDATAFERVLANLPDGAAEFWQA